MRADDRYWLWITGGSTPGVRQYYAATFVLVFLVWSWLAEHRGRW